MRKKVFRAKVFEMTFAMIVFNISNLCYNIFISNRLGAEEIGLFHLVGSVFSVGISLCVSGMSLTATRLLSDMPKLSGLMCSDGIIFKCLSISFITSFFATTFLYVGSDFIATSLLGKSEASSYIKTLSLCLIAVSVSSVLGGYFTAFGKVKAISTGRFFGEISNWGFTFFFLKYSEDKCMAIVKAMMLSIFIQCVCDIFFWRFFANKHLRQKAEVSFNQIIRLCTPIALGSYLRQGLSSLENLLIPKRLKLLSADALSKYGMLKGMTMPILFFPSVLISAFVSLLVPEIARRFSQREKNSVGYVSLLSLNYIIRFGLCVSFIFFMWSSEIASKLFSDKSVGDWLHLLAFLPFFMYVDSVTDAILKGLNEQVFSLKVNTIDAISRVVMVFFCVPVFGVRAYIAILYISEILNLSFSFWRLRKITALRFSFCRAVMPSLFSLGCAFFITYLLRLHNPTSQILTFISAYIGISELCTS